MRTRLLAALSASLLTVASPALAQSPIQLRVAGHFTSNNRHTEGIERPFFSALGQTTGINLAVTFNPMDQVGAAAGQQDAHHQRLGDADGGLGGGRRCRRCRCIGVGGTSHDMSSSSEQKGRSEAYHWHLLMMMPIVSD